MNEKHRHCSVCIRNEDHEESLELKTIYELLDDPKAEEHNMVSVIDEEGEDYLYPASYFVFVSFPAEVEKILQHVS